MARILALSGTPGVGKSSVASAIATAVNAEVISMAEFVGARNLQDAYDVDRSTRVVDEGRAREALLREIVVGRSRDDVEWVIIEGLMADVVADQCDLAVVLRLDPRVVKARLELRGYDPKKVAENVQAELLGTCTYHMQEMRKDFLDVDTTGKDIGEVAKAISSIMRGGGDKEPYRPGLVDWISRPDIDPAAFF
ncbi:MAG: adenylate kinase family protein [Candidatus Lokiarchaeota archaeon]|nr:adenylate kinase family protein [Candidatus Lokiarchaeota archaeon]